MVQTGPNWSLTACLFTICCSYCFMSKKFRTAFITLFRCHDLRRHLNRTMTKSTRQTNAGTLSIHLYHASVTCCRRCPVHPSIPCICYPLSQVPCPSTYTMYLLPAVAGALSIHLYHVSVTCCRIWGRLFVSKWRVCRVVYPSGEPECG